MRRIRLILYEGDERQFAHQFGTPEAPRGLQDGVHEGLATKITIATIDDAHSIDDIVEEYLDGADPTVWSVHR